MAENYDIIINSDTSYGQLIVGAGSTGSSEVSVSGLTSRNETHVYKDVVTGDGAVADRLANEKEVLKTGAKGVLAAVDQGDSATQWDLRVLNYGQDMAEPQAFLLERNAAAMRYALDYDCNLFDTTGVAVMPTADAPGGPDTTGFCVGVIGSSLWSDSGDIGDDVGLGDYSELSGTVIAAVQLTEMVRLGGFIGYRGAASDIDGIDDMTRMPMFGAFLGFSEVPDGTGIQARISAAYEGGSAEFSRANLVGSANTVSADGDLNTFGAAFELGWGLGLGGGHVLTPYAGVNYTNATRESYKEDSEAGVVDDAFHYDDYSRSLTSAIMGLRLEGPISDMVGYRLGAGVESTLYYDLDAFKVSGDFGSDSYKSDREPSDWRFNGQAGMSVFVAENAELNLDGYVMQLNDGDAPDYSVTAGFKLGF